MIPKVIIVQDCATLCGTIELNVYVYRRKITLVSSTSDCLNASLVTVHVNPLYSARCKKLLSSVEKSSSDLNVLLSEQNTCSDTVNLVVGVVVGVGGLLVIIALILVIFAYNKFAYILHAKNMKSVELIQRGPII